jgi:hypothetical protein
VWAYDANDLLRVKNGQLRPHEVRPYTVWSFDTPFQVIGRDVNGAAYDPTTRLLYVSLGEQDAPRPLVHVWRRVGAGTPPPPPPPPSDTTAPSVSITAPTQGQVVSGASVTFSATGTDNVGITQLESLLDGVVVQTTPAPVFPLSFPFDSRLIPDGAHVVQLRARDAAGNVGMSQAVSFTVTNAAPPPPPPPPPPPVLPTLTATMRTDTCSLRVAVDRTPDGTTGWGIQFRRGSVNHGTRDTTAPYEREAKDIARGSYAITGVWTKTGQAAVTLSYGTLTCE